MDLTADGQRIVLNGHLGTEIRGVQLTGLSDPGIEGLRELAADRGVLVFRDQNMDLSEQIVFARRLDAIHEHPLYADSENSAALRIHTDASSDYANGDSWHSDLSWNDSPPGLSILRMETNPTAGGDTAFASMYAAYATLSEPMQTFLSSLHATHMYTNVSDGEPPSSVHPVIRTHPISGRQALFVNMSYTTRIVELSPTESRAILGLLFAHIAERVDLQIRIRWEPGTVTIWDNRCTQHYASWDYFPETRTAWRVTTVGERPHLLPPS
jgi:taurine dioxygenase